MQRAETPRPNLSAKAPPGWEPPGCEPTGFAQSRAEDLEPTEWQGAERRPGAAIKRADGCGGREAASASREILCTPLRTV
jgi:hypothetical protein